MNEHIAHTPQIKRLERSTSESMVAGVAGGLGRYFELNPAVFRLGFVILTLLGGAGILVYLAAVLVIPVEGKEQSVAAQVLAERRDRPWPVVGLGLASVALVLLLSRGEFAAGSGWIVALIAGLAILWASRGQRRARRLWVALTAFLTLTVVAVGIAVVIAFTWFDVNLGDGVGEHTYAPVSAAAAQSSYDLGIGNLKVDLSQLDGAGKHRVQAHVGIGELKIVVPRDADVRVDAHANVGEVYVLRNHHDDGRNAAVHTGSGTFQIDAKVGAGRIDVVRAP
jgi:phage shock protein PspC (stress-responsive transcriptional regulator)